MVRLADELKELYDLWQRGALTEAEFVEAKRMVLRSQGGGTSVAADTAAAVASTHSHAARLPSAEPPPASLCATGHDTHGAHTPLPAATPHATRPRPAPAVRGRDGGDPADARLPPAEAATVPSPPRTTHAFGSLSRYYSSFDRRPEYEAPPLDDSTFSTAIELAHQAVQDIAHRVDVFDKYPPPAPLPVPAEVVPLVRAGGGSSTVDGPAPLALRGGRPLGGMSEEAARIVGALADAGGGGAAGSAAPPLAVAEPPTRSSTAQREALQALKYQQYMVAEMAETVGAEHPFLPGGSRLESPQPPPLAAAVDLLPFDRHTALPQPADAPVQGVGVDAAAVHAAALALPPLPKASRHESPCPPTEETPDPLYVVPMAAAPAHAAAADDAAPLAGGAPRTHGPGWEAYAPLRVPAPDGGPGLSEAVPASRPATATPEPPPVPLHDPAAPPAAHLFALGRHDVPVGFLASAPPADVLPTVQVRQPEPPLPPHPVATLPGVQDAAHAVAAPTAEAVAAAADAALDAQMRRSYDEYAHALADLVRLKHEAQTHAHAGGAGGGMHEGEGGLGAGELHAPALRAPDVSWARSIVGVADPHSLPCGRMDAPPGDVPHSSPALSGALMLRGAVPSPCDLHTQVSARDPASRSPAAADAPLAYAVRSGRTAPISDPRGTGSRSPAPVRPLPSAGTLPRGPSDSRPPGSGSGSVFADLAPRSHSHLSGHGSQRASQPQSSRDSTQVGQALFPTQPFDAMYDAARAPTHALGDAGRSRSSAVDDSSFSNPQSDTAQRARPPSAAVDPARCRSANALADMQWDAGLYRGVRISPDGREATCVPNDSGGHVIVATAAYDPHQHTAYTWATTLLLNGTACKDVLVGLTGRGDAGNATYVLRGDGCAVSERNGVTRVGQGYAGPLRGGEGRTTTVECKVVDGSMAFVVDGHDYGPAFDLPDDLVFFPMVVLSEPGEAACLPHVYSHDG